MHPLVNISYVGFHRIDVGWGFTNRAAPHWRLYYDFDPGAAIDVEEGRINLVPGTIVVVPAGCMFTAIPPRTPARHLYLHFTIIAPGLSLPQRPFAVPVDASLKALLGDGNAATWKSGDPLLACAIVYRTLSLVLRPPDAGEDYELRHIRECLHTRLTVTRLAHQAGITADHFIRRFASRYGTTPARFIANERLALAGHLLSATDLPIEEIARRCGFASRGHLGTAFKHATGLTPAERRAADAGRPGPHGSG